MKSVNEMNVDGFRMNASNVVLDDMDRFDFDYNSDLSVLMRRIRDLDGVSFCDFIIGFDELRSCIIVNLDECRKELRSLYKFKVLVVSVNDLNINWQPIIWDKQQEKKKNFVVYVK